MIFKELPWNLNFVYSLLQLNYLVCKYPILETFRRNCLFIYHLSSAQIISIQITKCWFEFSKLQQLFCNSGSIGLNMLEWNAKRTWILASDISTQHCFPHFPKLFWCSCCRRCNRSKQQNRIVNGSRCPMRDFQNKKLQGLKGG